ncbi:MULTISPECIES: glucose-6-phosphate isomerase [Pseudomonas]|jgi:glucose-6-phosphate isomerase|uniref:Glucose-6-phosphate isomerase n=1 Tax=Pseudomonas frederiksbergensis TaxID=104087 RepID=A0A0B1YTN9_9PSED|nr:MULTISPECIES: glucose-6-phosphate isomerase [Pseudomonas]KHK62044.1 glucose-6-phosphate isomerase [Pseudomonas frederiksbergensis]KJH83195.1 glucose-6-phosphate isomerase [Pseudomonas fluorescens]MBI6619772.1 glucose-6-phosphate isomerase [Pseudomonas corrugata]MBI6694161.1 glucose-6-phosphate isomerase [Pseudomonas corrugata]WRV67599.1 glucose-6-phosphate isomerase [Pseudomonas frederiksbergensis]
MAYYRTPQDVTALPAWQALNDHRKAMQDFSMREAFNADPQRFNQFTLSSCGLFLDYSKNLINAQTRDLLVGLANEVDLQGAIKALFEGEIVNASENRPALHTALRRPVGDKLLVNGVNVMPDVHKVLNQITDLVGRIHDGLWRGYTEKPITDVVNIGIGGSFLGPQLVSEALLSYTHKGVRCHYLANIDGSEFHELTMKLRAETTLFIVSSKSFNTLETLKNAQAARAWYLAQGGSEAELYRHFIAVSSNNAAAVAFGIREENIFPMWDWVGGRYSLWSAIGLPIALAIGMSNFKELLSGAYSMDQHFQSAPFEQNMPVLLALLGVWYGNFWGAQSHAILPYDHYLRNITKHLQQLDMESNGKSVRQDGTPVSTDTGPVIWGGVGCNGQHAYHQLLHQGTQLIPADFIVPIVSFNPVADHHQWLYANCLSQSQALMLGKTRAEAEAELREKGASEAEVQKLAAHKVIPGNRPSNTLVVERISPRRLGALVALYEHKVFVQSVVWGINAFDQWGVELGKELGKGVYNRLVGSEETAAEDASTQGLINYFRGRHRG